MKLPPSSKNWLTIIGSIIAAINLILILLLFVISTIFDKAKYQSGALYLYHPSGISYIRTAACSGRNVS